jgi:predicted nucleotidyltransferase
VPPGLYDCLVTAREHDLFDLLRSLKLPIGDFAVFGSGPLIVRGIIEATNDLDVISRGAAWERGLEVGELVTLPDGARIVSCFGGDVTIGRSWAYGDVDIDQLIDTAEGFDGLPFVRLEHVVRYKEIAARPKDVAHLQLLAHHQRDHPPIGG